MDVSVTLHDVASDMDSDPFLAIMLCSSSSRGGFAELELEFPYNDGSALCEMKVKISPSRNSYSENRTTASNSNRGRLQADIHIRLTKRRTKSQKESGRHSGHRDRLFRHKRRKSRSLRPCSHSAVNPGESRVIFTAP